MKAVIEVMNISGLIKIGSDPVTSDTSPLNGASDMISKIVSLRRGTRPLITCSGVSTGPPPQHASPP